MVKHARVCILLACCIVLAACERSPRDQTSSKGRDTRTHAHDDGHHHDHTHDHAAAPAEVELPQTFALLLDILRERIDFVEHHLDAGNLPAAAREADAIYLTARRAGQVALNDDAVPRDRVPDATTAGATLARAAEDVRTAANHGRGDTAREHLARLDPMLDKLAAVMPGRWVCDMHCEPGKTYDQPGTCPVCRMALTPLAEMPYTLAVSALSDVLEAGRDVELKIDLIDPVGLPVRDLAIVHEKPLHLIVVSHDLSWYAHEHPQQQADGSFTAVLAFPRPGEYTLFADFTPRGKPSQSPSSRLAIAGRIPGDAPAPAPLADDTGDIKEVDGHTFRIRCNGGEYVAGSDVLLRYGIARRGDDGREEPVTDLEPHLGATGHLVILSADLKTFIHAHPLSRDRHDHNHAHDHASPAREAELIEAADRLANGAPHDPIFHVVFPRPGFYRAFAEFRHAGRVITVPHTIEVKAGGDTPLIFSPAEQPHDHGGHDHHNHDDPAHGPH